jgi:hypothetical protein
MRIWSWVVSGQKRGRKQSDLLEVTMPFGRDVAQAVGRWLPTAAARVCVRASMWCLLWTKRHLDRFSPSTSVSPVNHHSTNFSIIISRGWHNSLIGGRSAGPNWIPTPHSTNLKTITVPLSGGTYWVRIRKFSVRIYGVLTRTRNQHFSKINQCRYNVNLLVREREVFLKGIDNYYDEDRVSLESVIERTQLYEYINNRSCHTMARSYVGPFARVQAYSIILWFFSEILVCGGTRGRSTGSRPSHHYKVRFKTITKNLTLVWRYWLKKKSLALQRRGGHSPVSHECLSVLEFNRHTSSPPL